MDTTSSILINRLLEDPKFFLPIAVAVLAKLILDFLRAKVNSEKVEKAEKEAFNISSNMSPEQLKELTDEHANLKQEAAEVKQVVEESQNALVMGRLFNLYSKQIEKYQQETRTRASWSFVFAIISMFLGLGFVFWGGTHIIGGGTDSVTAGAAISAIGGGISAYITKTFLDVHKLSLTQLNKYFKQPVINDNILMAQRLADEIEDQTVRKESYTKIISSITNLIDSNNKEASSKSS